jgi:hypothetical protein
MNRRLTRTLAHASLAAVLAAAATSSAVGQCQLLVRESFRPGDRPHGGNGRLRDAQIHDTLKDYWPQTPADGTMWLSNDLSGVANWAFAGSSLDPAEVDPLDPYNGTAFGTAPAAALLPFTPPAGAFTTSAEAVMLFDSTSAIYLGYTSDPALLSNFETHGTLWMSLNGRGDWAILANGMNVVASGTAPIAGTLDSGWLHMEFTFDPVSSTVSGRIMSTLIPSTPVVLSKPMLYFGMEAHESWSVLNNLSISTGTALQVSAAGGGSACRGGTATFAASTNAASPSLVNWSRYQGWPLADGPQSDGSVVSGALTTTLTVSNLSPGAAGEYFCLVANECGSAFSNRVALVVGGCTADHNCSGTVSVQDIFDFLADYFAANSAADVNGSGAITVQDIFDFLAAYFAGCP